MKQHRAWTGGSGPKPIHQISLDELNYVAFLFNSDVIEYESFWKEKADEDVQKRLWKRARYDAHASFRKDEE